jgi:hypothetical protein
VLHAAFPLNGVWPFGNGNLCANFAGHKLRGKIGVEFAL